MPRIAAGLKALGVEPGEVGAVPVAPTPKAPTKSDERRKPWAIVAAGVLALVALGVAAVLLLSSGGSDEVTTKEAGVPTTAESKAAASGGSCAGVVDAAQSLLAAQDQVDAAELDTPAWDAALDAKGTAISNLRVQYSGCKTASASAACGSVTSAIDQVLEADDRFLDENITDNEASLARRRGVRRDRPTATRPPGLQLNRPRRLDRGVVGR